MVGLVQACSSLTTAGEHVVGTELKQSSTAIPSPRTLHACIYCALIRISSPYHSMRAKLYRLYSTMQAKLDAFFVPPASVRGMRRLDRAAFQRDVMLPAVFLQPSLCSKFLGRLRHVVLRHPRVKTVQTHVGGEGQKVGHSEIHYWVIPCHGVSLSMWPVDTCTCMHSGVARAPSNNFLVLFSLQAHFSLSPSPPAQPHVQFHFVFPLLSRGKVVGYRRVCVCMYACVRAILACYSARARARVCVCVCVCVCTCIHAHIHTITITNPGFFHHHPKLLWQIVHGR